MGVASVNVRGKSRLHNGAGLGSVDAIAEQPRFPAGGKDSDVTFENVVVDRHSAIVGVARQTIPLIQGVGHGIAQLGILRDFRRDVVEPRL